MKDAMILEYQDDEVILRQGDLDKNLYKVMSGNVVLYVNYGREDEYLIGVLSFPQCFGEMSVLIGEPSPYTAVALMETQVLRVPEENFEAFIKKDYQNAFIIMKNLAKNFSLVNMNMRMLIEELPHLEENKDRQEIVHPEYEKYVTDKKFLCPHCGREFTDSFILRSKLIPLRTKPEERRFDVRVEYDGFDDEWYEIITCPHCYFSALDRLWEDASRVNRVHYEKQLESLRGTLHLNYQSDRDINHVLARHYLALECAAGFSISRKIRAYLWDNLRWLYWCTGDVEMLQFARNKAIDAYKETYIRDELLPNQQQYICLRIAEMLYQNGEFDDIRQWLDAVGKITHGDAKYQKLAKEMIKELEKADKEY